MSRKNTKGGCTYEKIHHGFESTPPVTSKGVSNDEAVFARVKQLEEKYSSAAALREEFSEDYYGDDVEWEVTGELA